jgi:DNA topoisomerase-1
MNNRIPKYILRKTNIRDYMKNKSIEIKVKYYQPKIGSKNYSNYNNEKTIEYIKSLKIPTGYPISYISTNPNTKILAISFDLKGKKQYKYHPDWIEFRMKEKNCNLVDLTKNMPKIVEFIEAHIEKLNKEEIGKNLQKAEYQIALILKLMLECNFRIGNEIGEKQYQSYGLTTLKNKHIKIENNKIKIDFIGKKGVENICELCNPTLQRILSKLKQESRKNDDSIFTIKATEFNDYLKNHFDCTSKDIRSWMANMIYIYYLTKIVKKNYRNNLEAIIPSMNKNKNKLKEKDKRKMEKLRKKIMKEAIEETAIKLHHTPGICKKSYLFEPILNAFLIEPTEDFIEEMKKISVSNKSKREMSARVSTVERINHKEKIVPNQVNKKEVFSTSVIYKNREIMNLFNKIVMKPCKVIDGANKVKRLEDFKLPKGVIVANK